MAGGHSAPGNSRNVTRDKESAAGFVSCFEPTSAATRGTAQAATAQYAYPARSQRHDSRPHTNRLVARAAHATPISTFERHWTPFVRKEYASAGSARNATISATSEAAIVSWLAIERPRGRSTARPSAPVAHCSSSPAAHEPLARPGQEERLELIEAGLPQSDAQTVQRCVHPLDTTWTLLRSGVLLEVGG